MRARSGIVTALGGMIVAVAASRCEKSPTSPALPISGFPHVQFAVPGTLAPGQTLQLRVTFISSTGAQRDVTSDASYKTSDPNVLTIGPSGLVTARAAGDVTITVGFDRYSSVKPLVIVPPGTDRVVGILRQESTNITVTGARVEVRSAGEMILETTTDSAGVFKLYGVPAEAELRITREGFAPRVEPLHLTDHAALTLELALAGPRPDISGTYTLTVGSSSCDGSKPLPPDLRRRSYRAAVTQSGPTVRVTLSGAEFRKIRSVAANSFTGTVDPAGVTFRLAPGTYYYYYSTGGQAPEVLEALSDDTVLLVAGTAAVAVSGTSLSGTLNGTLEQHSRNLNGLLLGRCTSASHTFVLTR